MTAETHNLFSLAEKVEGLTGPCRETDLAVFQHLWLDPALPAGEAMWKMENPPARIPAYTASIDDVAALIADKLPDRSWGVERRRLRCQAYVHGADSYFTALVVARTPALALLAAFLRAKGEQNGNA